MRCCGSLRFLQSTPSQHNGSECMVRFRARLVHREQQKRTRLSAAGSKLLYFFRGTKFRSRAQVPLTSARRERCLAMFQINVSAVASCRYQGLEATTKAVQADLCAEAEAKSAEAERAKQLTQTTERQLEQLRLQYEALQEHLRWAP